MISGYCIVLTPNGRCNSNQFCGPSPQNWVRMTFGRWQRTIRSAIAALDAGEPIDWPHTHPFNGPFSGTTQVSRYQKGKPILTLLKQETVSGSGISWAICKSAPRSRQITMLAPHHWLIRGRMPFLLPNQQRQSTEGKTSNLKYM